MGAITPELSLPRVGNHLNRYPNMKTDRIAQTKLGIAMPT